MSLKVLNWAWTSYCAQLVKRVKMGEFSVELGLEIADRRAARRQAEALRSAKSTCAREHADRCLSTLPDALRKPLERIGERSAARSPDVDPNDESGVDGAKPDAPSG